MLIFPLLIAAFGIYGRCVLGDFVYDDMHTTIGDEPIAAGRWIGFLRMPLIGAWRHIARASFALNVRLWGPAPFSFHIVNIVLHAANAYALSFVLTGLGATPEIATLGPFLFLCHPLARDSAAYIASRSVLLSSGFALGAFAVILHGYWPLAFVFLLLAFYSKEDSAIAVPCCAAILAIQGQWLTALAFIVPPLIVIALLHKQIRAMSVATEQQTSGAITTALTAAGHNAIPSAWVCAKTSFTATVLKFPAWCFGYGQNFDHDTSVPTRAEFGTAIALSIGFVAAFLAAPIPLKLALAIIAISPSIVYWFIPLRDAIYEYRCYLSLAGACILAALIFTPLPVVLYVAIPLFAFQSYARAHDFAHPIGVWSGAVRDGSDRKVRVLTNLAACYQLYGDEANARLWNARVLELDPKNGPAMVNMALLEARTGNLPHAQRILFGVTSLYPAYAFAWQALKAVCTALNNENGNNSTHIQACDERIAALGGS